MAARKARGRDVRGILLLDKPRGLTSNQALQRTKGLFQAAKAGHTGSLDPLATGMLPICFGAATKLSGYLLDARKTYRVAAELGVATDTGDADGVVTERRAGGTPPSAEAVEAAMRAFEGEIAQVPPMYSALKQGGRRLYELARRGEVVEREPRRITIHGIELEAYRWPECRFEVTCSKGTYVRTLVTDLAEALGTVGHVTALRRLAVEPFREQQMCDSDALERAAAGGLEALDRLLLPAESALAGWPQVVLPRALAERLLHGQRVPADPAWPVGWVCLLEPARGLIGLGEVSPEGELVPRRLFG